MRCAPGRRTRAHSCSAPSKLACTPALSGARTAAPSSTCTDFGGGGRDDGALVARAAARGANRRQRLARAAHYRHWMGEDARSMAKRRRARARLSRARRHGRADDRDRQSRQASGRRARVGVITDADPAYRICSIRSAVPYYQYNRVLCTVRVRVSHGFHAAVHASMRHASTYTISYTRSSHAHLHAARSVRPQRGRSCTYRTQLCRRGHFDRRRAPVPFMSTTLSTRVCVTTDWTWRKDDSSPSRAASSTRCGAKRRSHEKSHDEGRKGGSPGSDSRSRRRVFRPVLPWYVPVVCMHFSAT